MNNKGKKLGDYAIPLRAKNQSFVKPYPHETWKEYRFNIEEGAVRNRRYAISNMGRFGSFYKSIDEDMVLVQRAFVLGYYVARLWYLKPDPETGKMKRANKSVSIHKALAELFLPKRESDEPLFVIHLDYDKVNNDLSNLAWVTQKELTVHAKKNPKWVAKQAQFSGKGKKLTAGQVLQIKKLLAEKKTRYRTIAQRFGISTTMLEDIRKEKKWKHIQIEEKTKSQEA